jgi:hypothetical protein
LKKSKIPRGRIEIPMAIISASYLEIDEDSPWTLCMYRDE